MIEQDLEFKHRFDIHDPADVVEANSRANEVNTPALSRPLGTTHRQWFRPSRTGGQLSCA